MNYKRIVKLILFLLITASIPSCVLAYTSNDGNLTNRSVCPNIELAHANTDGTITSVDCYDNYNQAREAMYNYTETVYDDLMILEKVSGKTKVIDAKYAILELICGANDTNNIYDSPSLTYATGYMNNYSSYGGIDAAMLDLNYPNKAAKIKISGVEGWIKNGTYVVVPVNWVKSSHYYKQQNKSMWYGFVGSVQTNSDYGSNSFAERGFLPTDYDYYYSYDAHYFYSNRYDMLKDYKEGSHDRSVNKGNPLYAYYQYLTHRSKTTYSPAELDEDIRSNGNTHKLYGKLSTSGGSLLYSSAEDFLESENIYGANAILMYALSRNESGNGTSYIARMKNNLFGHQAYDSSPFASAGTYISAKYSIFNHAYSYISRGYSNPQDSRYRGSQFGSKNSGMNVKYASDPYWSLKAAHYSWLVDAYRGMKDYNYYQVGVTLQSTGAYYDTNAGSIKLYTLPVESGVLILEEVEGQEINGNKIWYKVQSDANLNKDRKSLSSAGEYNWDSYVYVHSSNILKTNNAGKNSDGTYHSPAKVKNEPITNSSYIPYSSKDGYNPKVVRIDADKVAFQSSSLVLSKGTLKKGAFVTVLEELKQENVSLYRILIDYSTNQYAWIDSVNTVMIDKDLFGYVNTGEGANISAYNNVGGTKNFTIYSDNYLPILDKKQDGNTLWLKVQTNPTNLSSSWVKASDGTSYTIKYLNEAPVIKGENFKLVQNNEHYNLLDYITATDKEDGDITKNVTVKTTNLDITTLGDYQVIYTVTDSEGLTFELTLIITVMDFEEAPSLFMFNSFSYSGFDHPGGNSFEFSGFLGCKGMDNIDVKHTMIFVNQITNEEIEFPLDNWGSEYPYEMSSLDDKKSYNYKGGWFKSELDLSNLAPGDYTLYVKAVNGIYKTKTLFTNIAYLPMVRRINGTRSYSLDIDYTSKGSPLLFSIRNRLLVGETVPPTLDKMYNFFTDIKLENSSLYLKGTSHNFGVELAKTTDLTRKVVFEETTTFNRYSFNIGSILDGDYPVKLALSDNLDKTRAWYKNTIDLSGINPGNYAVYILNDTDENKLFGELIDVQFLDFSTMNNSKYEIHRIDERRMRLELLVK